MSKLVGIVLGSDSDLPVMEKCFSTLEEFGVKYEVAISSAHRLPDETANYGRAAAGRGIKVLIAAAGMAAHLPGVLAAHTILPVIGVPVAGVQLAGADALYSIVQMPPGVPVATVGLNASHNAALLAVQILAAGDDGLKEKLKAYKTKMAEAVREKNRRLQDLGVAEYRRQTGK